VGSPHARVGHCQASNQAKTPCQKRGFFAMCEIQKTIEIVFCVEFGVDFVRKKPHKREGYLGGWPFLFYGSETTRA
ncbi:hypothetical protein N4220_04165, partial [Yersinia enterocolitica]